MEIKAKEIFLLMIDFVVILFIFDLIFVVNALIIVGEGGSVPPFWEAQIKIILKILKFLGVV